MICTSSNAVELVKRIPKDVDIIFAPDKNLGRWVENQSGRKLTLWDGSCIVHETFSEEEVLKLKINYPKAEIIAHPECQQNLLDLANFIGSTSRLLDYTGKSSSSEFIVLTEPGIIHQMKIKEPHKCFYEVPGINGCSCNECPYMRLNTLEKLHNCLETMHPRIEIEEDIRIKALKPIEKMLAMS